MHKNRRVEVVDKRQDNNSFDSKIGILAGTFDPIHDGHLQVAETALINLELDRVYFAIEEQPRNNKRPITIRHRNKMLQLAIAGFPNFKCLNLPDKQFNIGSTLRVLERTFNESQLFFIFGADVFMQMNSTNWSNLESLLKHRIVVFERGLFYEKEIKKHAIDLNFQPIILPSKLPLHSSTDIRLKSHNKNIWIPKKVLSYINKNNLY